jgi:DNA-binding transcriptional ArsR family regulator
MKAYAHPSVRELKLPGVMHALSDPVRLSIVRALLRAPDGELACNEIPLKVVKATRSHHFAVLREAGLIFTRTDGTKCMTSVRVREIEKRFPGLLDLVVKEKKARRVRAAAQAIPPRRRATWPRPTPQ